MKLIILLTALISSNVFAKQKYGEPISLKSMPISLAHAIKSPSTSPVLVKAKVGKVCKKKGCWMVLENKDKDIRVTFKNYGFFVPISLVGKQVLLQGILTKHTMSLEETKHYVSDEGGDISKVTKPRSEYRLVASAVETLK